MNGCLHESTSAKSYPLFESDKYLLENTRKDRVRRSAIVFTRKNVVEETLIRNSTNRCETSVGSYAGHHCPSSSCKAMPDGLYTKWELDFEYGMFTSCQKKTKSFENKVMLLSQVVRPQSEVGRFYKTGAQKKLSFSTNGFCGNSNTAFGAMGCCSQNYSCQEALPPLTDVEIQRVVKQTITRRNTKTTKTKKVLQRHEENDYNCWKAYNTNNFGEQHLCEFFAYETPLREERL